MAKSDYARYRTEYFMLNIYTYTSHVALKYGVVFLQLYRISIMLCRSCLALPTIGWSSLTSTQWSTRRRGATVPCGPGTSTGSPNNSALTTRKTSSSSSASQQTSKLYTSSSEGTSGSPSATKRSISTWPCLWNWLAVSQTTFKAGGRRLWHVFYNRNRVGEDHIVLILNLLFVHTHC